MTLFNFGMFGHQGCSAPCNWLAQPVKSTNTSPGTLILPAAEITAEDLGGNLQTHQQPTDWFSLTPLNGWKFISFCFHSAAIASGSNNSICLCQRRFTIYCCINKLVPGECMWQHFGASCAQQKSIRQIVSVKHFDVILIFNIDYVILVWSFDYDHCYRHSLVLGARPSISLQRFSFLCVRLRLRVTDTAFRIWLVCPCLMNKTLDMNWPEDNMQHRQKTRWASSKILPRMSPLDLMTGNLEWTTGG